MSNPNYAPMTLDARQALNSLLARLHEHVRVRDDFVRADVRLELQIQSIERRLGLRAPKVETVAGVALPKQLRRPRPTPSPLALSEGQNALTVLKDAQEVIAAQRRLKEREITALAQQLPIWPWVASVRGFGALGFGQIIAATTVLDGETVHDLCDYANPAKVWKRMGLAVINGERQRKTRDPQQALLHGFSPQKRALMYVICESLMKGNQDGLYHTIYANRKAIEQERHPELALIICHKRAMRYMGKILLKHVWQQWRAACGMQSDGV